MFKIVFTMMPDEQFHEARPETPEGHFPCATEMLPKYKCNICKYSTHLKILSFKHRHYYNNVRAEENLRGFYFCKECNNFQSNSLLLLLKHEVQCKNEAVYTNYFYKCGQCHFTSSLRQDVKSHSDASHSSEDIWCHCPFCDYKVGERCKMKCHILALHTASSKIHWIKCELCPYKAKMRSYMRNHMKMRHTQHEKYPHKCDLCPFESFFVGNLRRHYNCVHEAYKETEWLPCDRCNFKTKSRKHLQRHSDGHTDGSLINWVKCEVCPFTCKQKRSLRAHVIREHKALKEADFFTCDFCEYKNVDKYNLIRHVKRKHEGIGRRKEAKT